MKYQVFFLRIGVLILLGFGLLWGVQRWLEAALLSPESFQTLGELFPRLGEMSRKWGPEKLAELSRQIPGRGLVLMLFFAFFWFCLSEKETADPEKTGQAVHWRVRFFFGAQLLYLPDLLTELTQRGAWKAFYTPLPYFGWVMPAFPPMWLLQYAVLACFGIGAWFILSKWTWQDRLPVLFWGLMILIWTFMLATLFGFGKIDHTYASLYAGLWGCGYLLWQSRRDFTSVFRHHLVFQASIWACYFFSGMEKVFLSGLDWLSSAHLKTLCLHHSGWACSGLSEYPVLVLVLFGLGWAFQLTTPFQMWFPRWGWVNAVLAILFHIGTGLLLGVGGWQSPWIATALFLIPLANSGKRVVQSLDAVRKGS